jgi:hypothetical protein
MTGRTDSLPVPQAPRWSEQPSGSDAPAANERVHEKRFSCGLGDSEPGSAPYVSRSLAKAERFASTGSPPLPVGPGGECQQFDADEPPGVLLRHDRRGERDLESV